MLKISYRTKFKKELKQQEKRGKDLKIFLNISKKLAKEEPLEKNIATILSKATLKTVENVTLSQTGYYFISQRTQK